MAEDNQGNEKGSNEEEGERMSDVFYVGWFFGFIFGFAFCWFCFRKPGRPSVCP